jgi:hypothetical protein
MRTGWNAPSNLFHRSSLSAECLRVKAIRHHRIRRPPKNNATPRAAVLFAAGFVARSSETRREYARWFTQKVHWKRKFRPWHTHTPRKSRHTVTSVDNQGLSPSHLPSQTVTDAVTTQETAQREEGGKPPHAVWNRAVCAFNRRKRRERRLNGSSGSISARGKGLRGKRF